MKRYNIAFILVFLFFTFVAQAQKVTLKLINGSSLQPIEGATLKSYLNVNTNVLSDKFGHITLTLKENDTLTISKEYYHPLYLFVKVKNFDTTHVISINMVPSKEIHQTINGNFTSLSDFEYHFVHDQIGNDSHLKVTGFEHPTASQLRSDMMHTNKNPDGFHITPVIHHQHTGENKYSIK